MSALTGVTRDFAAQTGRSVEDATGALAKAFADPTKGALELNKELGVTVIIVTHDEDLAYKCSRVIRLVDGLIVDENTPLEMKNS